MDLKYFKPSEFSEYEKMSPDFLLRLDRARDIAGVPFVITSSFRSELDNERVNGAKNSAHLRGLAVDIRCTTAYDRYRIVYGLMAAGFMRIGIARNFVHCDIDASLPYPRIWLY